MVAASVTQCDLCPHRCALAPGKTGLCKVRTAEDASKEASENTGKPGSKQRLLQNFSFETATDEKRMFCRTEVRAHRAKNCKSQCKTNRVLQQAQYSTGSTKYAGILGSTDAFYGHVTALAVDPIEKKPLYHWRPGSQILSVGFSGCNLSCPFCQNWHISQRADAPGRRMKPEELVAAAAAETGDCGQIAYTYSEPLVHAEFLVDSMTAAREADLATILVSNGCANEQTAEAVLSLTSAANIDLKCFSEKTYRDILGGDLQTVLDFIRLSLSLGVHTEITTLVVPGLNDSEQELEAAAAFIAALAEVPPVWHLSAYHPDWKWDASADTAAPATRPEQLAAAAERARAVLPYVYTGNTGGDNDTACPHCGAALVRRRGYSVDTSGLAALKPASLPVSGHEVCGLRRNSLSTPAGGQDALYASRKLHTKAMETAASMPPGLQLPKGKTGGVYYCAVCGKPTPIRRN